MAETELHGLKNIVSEALKDQLGRRLFVAEMIREGMTLDEMAAEVERLLPAE